VKLCARCEAPLDETGWTCEACGFTPPLIAGFRSFAPDLAASEEGFDADLFDQLHGLEAGNYWFRARNALLIWAIHTYFSAARTYLEIGCGTGFVLQGVAAAMPQLQICASEVSATALPYAAQRVPRAELLQMDARAIPYEDHFDLIGMFDVLEHIADDVRVLTQAHRALHAGGGVVITVPQHRFLWSQFDERGRHVRRYAARELAAKVAAAGFRIVMTTSFVSLLLPLMMLSRLRQRGPRVDDGALAELRVGRLANVLLEAALACERVLITRGVRFPAGGSLLLIARRS
jgi:SAM-dependent methyltransferase